jgi:phage baseplate assembly protein W
MPTPTWFGFNYPFWVTPRGILRPQADTRIIKNDLLQLLLTSPGERRMRPSYGTKIRKFPFEPFSKEDIADLRDSIRSAIIRFEPRVILRDIIIDQSPDINTLTISVLCALSRDPNIELSVELVTSNPATIAPTQQSSV